MSFVHVWVRGRVRPSGMLFSRYLWHALMDFHQAKLLSVCSTSWDRDELITFEVKRSKIKVYSVSKYAKIKFRDLFPRYLQYASTDFLQTFVASVCTSVGRKTNWLGFEVKGSKITVIGRRRHKELDGVHLVLANCCMLYIRHLWAAVDGCHVKCRRYDMIGMQY